MNLLRIYIPFWALVSALFLWSGCGEGSDPAAPSLVPESDFTLLALGDSYTVGHSLPTAWSWPYQLSDSLAAQGDSLRGLDVIAKTGWTTRDLLNAVRDSLNDRDLMAEPFGLVTLMIGVNNQFQDVDVAIFSAEMDTLIALAMDLAGGVRENVLGFSIPDYGVTPVGELFGSAQIARELEIHNAILRQKFGDQGIVMLDITPLSLQAANEPQLVAKDGLHYSREMYSRWVSLMLPAVLR